MTRQMKLCGAIVVGAWLVVLGFGCSEPVEPRELGTKGHPIFYGTVDDVPSHAAVVAVTDAGGAYFCSGTLISEYVVLTAAHCLEGETAAGVRIFFGSDVDPPAIVGEYRNVSEILVHPQYTGSGNDLALARLSSAPPAGIAPIPALPLALGLTAADNNTTTVDFSGFGLTENDTDGIKLHVDGTIALVCAGPASCTYSGNSVVPKSFAYSQAGAIGGPCSGDSGGPAFVLRDGVEYTAGVTSYGDWYCTEYGVSATVSEFESFITNFINQLPPESCANGVDDDEDGATDCDDSDCAGDVVCLPNACTVATRVGCGSSLSSTTQGATDLFSAYSCAGWAEDGPEKAYLLDIPEGAQVTVNMDPTQQTRDLDLFLLGGACDPGSCIDQSSNGGSDPEQIVFTMPAGGAYAIVETYAQPATFTFSVSCQGASEDCDNTFDEDGDGAIDCADPDCLGDPACGPVPEVCDNGADDDGDGFVDCLDSDCAAAPNCQPVPEVCDNGADDDGDGLADCDDVDCAAFPACIPTACGVAATVGCGASFSSTTAGATDLFDTYSCTGVTEGGPELAYFLDLPEGTLVILDMEPTQANRNLDLLLLGGGCDPAACLAQSSNPGSDPEQLVFSMPAGGAYVLIETPAATSTFNFSVTCPGPAEICDNGADDDGDGQADCDDADCAAAPNCQPVAEICDNGADDDGDGQADCDDADCAAAPNCQPVAEICDNGADDDGDGQADCDDTDCAAAPNCQPVAEICDNGADDDGDGQADCDDADCAAAPNCQPVAEICDNGADDDGDGQADCDDADCAASEICSTASGAGCGCSASGAGQAGELGLAALGLGLLILIRRRR